jgi:hypothetical protein
MTNSSRYAVTVLIAGFVFFSLRANSQPVDYSNCPSCTQNDISLHSETINLYQGVRGFNPYRPYTYGLIGDRKFSGTGYIISNPFFGLNWFPIRLEKQMLTGTFLEFSVSNYGDESDWCIHLLPDVQFQDFITDAIPYQKDNWYADGSWKTGPDGRFLIEAEITPDERRYGNPWFNNAQKYSPLINKRLTVYGPFVREEAHGNHPEIHPAEQIWWTEPNGQTIVLLVIDDSNRFESMDDYSSERVKITPAHPWAEENGQRATMSYAFEVNPATGGQYIAIQAIDDLEFHAAGDFADQGDGSKHIIRYKGNTVLTVQEADATDKFLGIKFRNVCFNTATGKLQGFIDIETAIGNGSGKEGFVALQINKQDVPLNAKPALFTGDLFNTWKNFGFYDDQVAFSDIYRGNMYGNGMVHGIIDFNGNGKSDLFAHKNGSWLVLFDGKGTWTEIGSSNIPVSEYRFGDINGDGITDILRNGPNNNIMISYSGREQWTVLTEGGEQNRNFQLGDFNGDGRADILYTKFKLIGSYPNQVYRADMYVKYNGAGSFKEINNDYHTDPTDYANNFRFGDFNGDKITDAFRWHNNKFRVYWGSRGDIKDLANVPAGTRPADLYFVHNFTIGGKTDIIYINPQTKQWTVYGAGQPGTLPLTIKHSDPNTIVFADLDSDLAQEPVALELVAGESTTPGFPTARKAEISPSMMAQYVPGSVKKINQNGKQRLSFSHDLMFFGGRTTDRQAPPRSYAISSVIDMATSNSMNYTKFDTTVSAEGYKKIARVDNISMPTADRSAYAVNFSAMSQKQVFVPAYGISAHMNNYSIQKGTDGSWDAWKTYLSKIARPGKEVMLQQALATPKLIRTVNFELAPFYACVEENKLSEIEIDAVAKELNDIAYGKNTIKRLALFGGLNVFSVTWTYELKNLTTGQAMTVSNPGSIAKTGKWKGNKIVYNFPVSNDLLQLTAKATIKDIFGHTQPKPLEFVFWNQQLDTDGTPAQLNNWLNQFLGRNPGFIWVVDHWERVRAGQQDKPQPMQIALQYLAEDKVLTVKEIEQILK